MRDIACGLLVFVLLTGAESQLLGCFLLVASGIPLGDAVIVRRSSGPRVAVYGVHGATAAVMLAMNLFLLAG